MASFEDPALDQPSKALVRLSGNPDRLHSCWRPWLKPALAGGRKLVPTSVDCLELPCKKLFLAEACELALQHVTNSPQATDDSIHQAVAMALAETMAQKEQKAREYDLQQELGPDGNPTQEDKEELQREYNTSLGRWTALLAEVLKKVEQIVPSWCAVVRDHATKGGSSQGGPGPAASNTDAAGLRTAASAANSNHDDADDDAGADDDNSRDTTRKRAVTEASKQQLAPNKVCGVCNKRWGNRKVGVCGNQLADGKCTYVFVCKKAAAAAQSREEKRRKLPAGVFLGVGSEPAARGEHKLSNTKKAFDELAEAAEEFGMQYGMHTMVISVGVFRCKQEYSAKNDVNLAGAYVDNVHLDGVPVDQGMRVVVMKAGTPGPVLDAMAPCPGLQVPKPNMADPAVAGAVFMRSATNHMSGLIAPAVKKAFEKAQADRAQAAAGAGISRAPSATEPMMSDQPTTAQDDTARVGGSSSAAAAAGSNGAIGSDGADQAGNDGDSAAAAARCNGRATTQSGLGGTLPAAVYEALQVIQDEQARRHILTSSIAEELVRQGCTKVALIQDSPASDDPIFNMTACATIISHSLEQCHVAVWNGRLHVAGVVVVGSSYEIIAVEVQDHSVALDDLP